MNKITIFHDHIESILQDKNIQVTTKNANSEFDIMELHLKVVGSTSLELHNASLEDLKVNVFVDVLSNVNFELFELGNNTLFKAQYHYKLESNSYTQITKFYDCNEVKELDIIELNGEHAYIKHHLNSIAKKTQRLDMVVYHNAADTHSDIVNHGVTIQDGKLQVQVTSIVYQGMKNCVVNQNNRIIVMNEQKSNINPILLIEEHDVTANHAAYIGTFKEDQIFYLMSRGISKDLATQLLVKGFLLESISQVDQIQPIIEQYWR